MSGPPRNSAGRYVVNASSSVAIMVIRMMMHLWANQYLLRRIEPAEYALVPIITSLMIVVELLPMIFLRGLSRFMVEADAQGDREGVARIVSSMVPVLAAVSAVVLLVGIAATVWIDHLIAVAPEYRADARTMLILLVGVLCLTIATTPYRVGHYVRMRFVEQNLIMLLTELLRTAALISLLFFVSTRALWVVVANVIGGTANILIFVACTRQILPEGRFHLRLVSGATVVRLLSFSVWTLVQGLNNLVLRAAPALLLNRHTTPIDVASFHVGNLADVQIRRLVTAAVSPAMPALTTIYATEGEGAVQKFYWIGGRYYLWAALFLTPPLLVFAYPLIDLYVGDRYRTAATVMILILGAYPFTWAGGMYYDIAYAVGRIRTYNIFSLFLTIVPLSAMWYLVAVRELGATGAALGLAGGYAAVHLFIMWPFGLRLVQGKWRDFLRRTLLPGLSPFLAALAASTLYGQIVPIESWGAFLGGCGISAAIYLAVLFGLCLAPEDRVLVRRARARLMRGRRRP